jgi:arylsulfatase A-like enzyme
MKPKISFNMKYLVYSLLLFCGMASCTPTKEEPIPPNIIVFLVDDMGLMDSSVPFLTDMNGKPKKYPLNDFYQTPNMELLAEQGIRFSNFYAHSVCSPSRVSLLTGQNSARHRVSNYIKPESNNRSDFGPMNWKWEGLDKESVTLPRLLREQGYKTIHVGKAHFGPLDSEGEDPLNLGFDVNIAGSSIGQPGSYYGKDGFGHIKGLKIRAVSGLEKYHGEDIFLTEALTLEANLAISQAKEEGKPFFLNMAHYAVHAPFHSDPRFADKYKDSGQPEKAQAYATLIEGIDKSLGDIVQHVKHLGLGENTLLFFVGDNGSDAPLPTENHYGSSYPLKGKKAKHWEGGMRVPFIASWVAPNDKVANQQKTPIPSNAVQEQMGSIIDLFTTLCHLVDVNPPEGHITDGYALQEQLSGLKSENREEQFLNHFPHDHRSSYFTSFVRSDWKIIYHFQVDGEPRYELFNLKEDPFETNNIAEKNSEQLKIMMGALADELRSKEALYPEKEGEIIELIMPL